jgi:hypothetical protein
MRVLRGAMGMGMRERWVVVWLLVICLCVLGSMVQARSDLRGWVGVAVAVDGLALDGRDAIRFSFFLRASLRAVPPRCPGSYRYLGRMVLLRVSSS